MRGVERMVGLVSAGAVAAILLASAAIYVVSEMRLNQRVDAPTESIPVSTDISAVQHGQHLASAIAMCTDCHGPNMAGKVVLEGPAALVVAPNLTRGGGGVGASRTDVDFVRAIRHGVDPSGRQLLLMPSDDYNRLSTADLGAIIAFVRSLPPVSSALPNSEVRPFGRVLFATGQLPLLPAVTIDHSAPRPPPPDVDVTPEYGMYLAETAGCVRCHGPALSGGKMLGWAQDAVPAANLTPAGLGNWSEADFLRVMRTGRRPDGRLLDASMPWPYFAQMTELELRAIWRFIQTLPARASGAG